jgi:hypothetical protein
MVFGSFFWAKQKKEPRREGNSKLGGAKATALLDAAREN